jgi:hypothetical protein
MAPDIDLTRGGYGGDVIEEMYKDFTANHLEYWWHFREVLFASAEKRTAQWKRVDGQLMQDSEHEDLIALSLTNYAVYTNLVDAISFLDELSFSLHQFNNPASRLNNVRRSWKGFYSSLYSSLTAISNILCVIVLREPRITIKPGGEVWNHTPRKAFNLQSKGFNTLAISLRICIDKMIIRDQLDHYGLIWHSINRGSFLIDNKFTKGYIHIDASNIVLDIDAFKKAHDDLSEFVHTLNQIYKELSVSHGYLDGYLKDKGWFIDYSGYGFPHNGSRPKP